ncbi:MAG: component of SufBCD complex [Rhodobacterales bacterium RIFCSPHIGHO2_02_FULL_62_130]|nr:MAG: component of SufBCD complex [Rhodobacterales bacterium RIFCSPHIGHO2_02_FULL_62_130]OHC54339.1 MAG: component of SufBCD complex [Rhodobacterales bacterium RIFCSPHIGHO2_12_FULL_62_75]HCY98505.1 component of SufBCD complex [Rhodobacter sp.]
MQWYDVIFDLIDMRSFSNLWYWIVLAVMWSSVSHWVLGVPFDMISRARRYGGQAQADLEALVRITTGRLLHITRTAGSMLIAVAAFMVTMLLVLGFYYDVEFAQAVLFLLVPMILVTSLSLRAALRIETGQFEGQALDRLLARHRITTQLIGMVSIFVTSLFGMWQNMHIGILG